MALGKLESSLQAYCNALGQQETILKDLMNLQHQHNVLKAALDRVDHPLHSLQARFVVPHSPVLQVTTNV